MRERLKLEKMPFPCQLLCAPSSTAQSRLAVAPGTWGLPRRQDAMTLLCKVIRCRTHQGTGRVLGWESNMWTVSTNSVLRPHLQPLVLGSCRNGKDPGSGHKELLWLPSGWAKPLPPSTPIPPHLQGTHCTGGELGLRGQWSGHPAPCLGQESPHSSVSVYSGFFAPSQSLQKANLARQSKTRHLSSVAGSVTDFLCNCRICLCLSFHMYNWSWCQFCLFKGSRWLYSETPDELELWAIPLIQIYENPFGAKRYLPTWQHYFYHVGATYCTFSNFWNIKFVW